MTAIARDLTGRARRRQDRWRMVQRAARIMRTWRSMPAGHAPQRFADNLRICSCAICGGRKRAHNGPTMRERRHAAVDALPRHEPEKADARAPRGRKE